LSEEGGISVFSVRLEKALTKMEIDLEQDETVT
jgi:hypothetical protein